MADERFEEIKKSLANWKEEKKTIVKDPTLEKRFKDLCDENARKIAKMVGIGLLRYLFTVPQIEIKILKRCSFPAVTEGRTIFANQEYFSETEDDGALIHEITHAIMFIPHRNHNETTFWLEEGIADYVRDKLCFQVPWSTEHYKKGEALAGYQTSAHFLMYFEKLRPTIIRELSLVLTNSKYNEAIFKKLFGRSLSELVKQYEKEQEREEIDGLPVELKRA